MNSSRSLLLVVLCCLCQLGYGAATLSANDLAMAGGPGMGLQVGAGGMGLNMCIDEATLMGQAGRMVGLDVGMGGRPASVGMNGVSQETDVMRGSIDILPPDASATLFVDGLPLDCSRREAARIHQDPSWCFFSFCFLAFMLMPCYGLDCPALHAWLPSTKISSSNLT